MLERATGVILVATDFSDAAVPAARFARDHARRVGARLHVLHVVRVAGAQATADELLRRTAADLTPDAITALRVGVPAAEVVRYADEEEVDLVVLGRHGRTGATGALLGSVAEKVARACPRPVVLVPAEAPSEAFAVRPEEPTRCVSCGVSSEDRICAPCRARIRAVESVPEQERRAGPMAGEMTPEQIEHVLAREVMGHLGCQSGGRPYVLPMIYAYDGRSLYFRSADGRKIRGMRQNPVVCFQVESIRTLASWESVVVWGTYEELGGAEAVHAHELILSRLGSLAADPDAWPQPSAESVDDRLGHRAFTGGRGAVVARIAPSEKTGRFEHR